SAAACSVKGGDAGAARRGSDARGEPKRNDGDAEVGGTDLPEGGTVMKRTFSFALVLVLTLALGGAALASTPGELLIWADDTRAPVMEDLGRQFEAEFGVPVKVTELGFGDIRSQLAVAGPAGEGPDIIVGAHDDVGACADLALWDLDGQRSGCAVGALAPGPVRDAVPVYASSLGPDGVGDTARACLVAGHTALKLKVGFGREVDERNLSEARAVAGPDVALYADANQAWDVDEAVAMAPLLRAADV